MSHPTLLFGASSLGEGEFVGEKAQELLQWLKTNDISQFDTAALYPLSSMGSSENLLGEFQESARRIAVNTKVLLTDFSGKGSLAPESIRRSVAMSTSRLPGGISTLYCHIPDPETPVEDSATAFNQQYSKGHFRQLGLSNFPPDQVATFVQTCQEKQLIKPTVYQGQYNALCRTPEDSLLPVLRMHGLSFVAYSPLAGGFLTGNFTNGKNVTGTRFDDGHPGAALYKMQYDRPEMHAAIKSLEEAGKGHGIGVGEAALRWLYHRSELKEGDGIILGATKLHQVQQNVKEIRSGPLPKDLIKAFDNVWDEVCAAAEKRGGVGVRIS